MLRLAILLLIISFCLFIFVLERNRENKNTEEEKTEKKVLTTTDKIGIIHLIFLFLVLGVDIIDMFHGDFLYRNYNDLFRLVSGIEFFSWISLIPILFVTVLVILIRSLKKEKNGGTIASISLILSIITWVITLVTYAIHF